MNTSERWRRVQELCETVEGLPDADRDARLRDLEPDPTIRLEVMALLAALSDEERDRHAAAPTPTLVPARPDQVGGVRLLERLGSGGSGEVFRGVRIVNGVEQAVAVKLFHVNRDTPEHRARIIREQQMLATLTHPDIVGLLDAGVTDDGRPFLVMELVVGEPLTAHADDRRLGLEARIRLFLAVCDAVQSAHRQLIVHLDLKPSNILAARDGRVKLLDFGAAKLADPDAAFTRTESLTLRYASPERLRGEPVSVACDVYSLGLILFELLSGGWPFRGSDSIVATAERAGGRLEMLPLSHVAPENVRASLRGDLEAIAAKAIAHEPGDRYASVSDLAEDLNRYLAGEPVHAQSRGVGYRLGKFVRRHVWEVAAALLLVTALAGAAVYATAQARTAQQAVARLETQNRFLTSVFTLAGADGASHADMTVRQLLALAEARIAPTLGGNRAVAHDVELTLARGYVSQGAFDDSRRLLEGLITRAADAGDTPREAEARAHLSYIAYVSNDNTRALSEARLALAAWRDHPDRFAPVQAVSTLTTAANTLSYIALTDSAVRPAFDACLDLTQRYPDAADPTTRAQCLRGLAIADINVDSRYDEAVGRLTEAVALLRADPGATAHLGGALQILGLAHRHLGHFVEDEAAQRESLAVYERLGGADSVGALWQRAVWATSLVGVGRIDEAERVALEVLVAARRFYPERGSYLLWTPLSAAASATCIGPRVEACEALAREAVETLGPSPDAEDSRLAYARGLIGLSLARQGRRDEARPLIERALAQQTARKRVSPFTAAWQAALAPSPQPPG